MALRRLGIDFEVVGISEIDKYAIKAYMAVHGDTPNYGDISKIDWSSVPDFDFLTYSFPCTDISTAGQQKGLAEGSGTRSSLLWECRKAIEAKRPKYLLMENVKNLVSKKFTPYLKEWLRFLEGAKWRINTVWHYDKSMPNINEPFLLIDHKWALVLRIGCERDWAIMIKDKIFVKWAYIKDLIPTED